MKNETGRVRLQMMRSPSQWPPSADARVVLGAVAPTAIIVPEAAAALVGPSSTRPRWWHFAKGVARALYVLVTGSTLRQRDGVIAR